jgi:hypothetical protein
MAINIAGGLLIAAALNAGLEPVATRAFCDLLATAGHFIHRDGYTSRQSVEMVPRIMCGQMMKVGLADRRTSNGLPSASEPETEADRTPRGSSLAVMTANVSHV